MAKVAIIGTGYVGLVSGACLADFDNYVTCVDVDKIKIENLKKGIIPIYESGLADIVIRNLSVKRLQFTESLSEAVSENDVIFIAVGTPPSDDGSADLSHVEKVTREIGRLINKYKVIVNKSTVPIGTARKVKRWLEEEITKRVENGGVYQNDFSYDVVSNPEFLIEGAAVQAFTHPDRIVIGAETEKAFLIMRDVYNALYINNTPFIETSFESAEMIKYAANSFLAVKISFINEIANLCESTGADIHDVTRALGYDERIGAKYLNAGPGFGGSCFPKDTKALVRTARDSKAVLSIVVAAIQANEEQKNIVINKIQKVLGSLAGKKIAVLGLAFKPNTDDMREAPSLAIITSLAKQGATIKASDPAAITEAKWRLAEVINHITFFEDEYEAISESNALVIITEWNQYKNLDFERVKKLLIEPIIFDLRNIYIKIEIEKKGFRYYGVGQ